MAFAGPAQTGDDAPVRREGKWRCKPCERVNRGRDLECAGCGTHRDENTEFFLEDDAPVVADPARTREASAGPDWICARCSNANRALHESCQSCGAPREGNKTYKQDALASVAPELAAVERHRRAEHKRAKDDVSAAAAAYEKVRSRPLTALPNGGTLRGPLSAGCAILALLVPIFFAGMALFQKHDDTARVSARSWHRSIDLEVLRAVNETCWEQAPSGAYRITHRTEIYEYVKVQHGSHVEMRREKYQSGTKTVYTDKTVQTGTKKVKVGTKNLKNGYFEDVFEDRPVYGTRQVPEERAVYSWRDVPYDEPTYVDEPVYREKYAYTIDRWQTDRTENTEGQATSAPAWPSVATGPTARESGRHEGYSVEFQLSSDPTAKKSLSLLSADDYAKYPLGSAWHVQWRVATGVSVLGPLEAEAPK